MKVILLDNVKDIGKKGAIVNIADGLARNKLIPLKKVTEATTANIAKYQHLMTEDKNAVHGPVIPPKALEALAQSPIIVSARTDAHGSLYKAIQEREVLNALHAIIPAHLRALVTIKSITIPAPIKKIGHYAIKVGQHTVSVDIVSDK